MASMRRECGGGNPPPGRPARREPSGGSTTITTRRLLENSAAGFLKAEPERPVRTRGGSTYLPCRLAQHVSVEQFGNRYAKVRADVPVVEGVRNPAAAEALCSPLNELTPASSWAYDPAAGSMHALAAASLHLSETSTQAAASLSRAMPIMIAPSDAWDGALDYQRQHGDLRWFDTGRYPVIHDHRIGTVAE